MNYGDIYGNLYEKTPFTYDITRKMLRKLLFFGNFATFAESNGAII